MKIIYEKNITVDTKGKIFLLSTPLLKKTKYKLLTPQVAKQSQFEFNQQMWILPACYLEDLEFEDVLQNIPIPV